MTDHDEFVALVEQMRVEQRIFFSKSSTGTAKHNATLRAIPLEREVDRRIAKWRAEQTQPRLEGMIMSNEVKPLPLATAEGIALSYPEHAKMRVHNAEIEAVERFIQMISAHTHDVRICKRREEWEYNEDTEEEEAVVRWYTVSTFGWDYRALVFALFGIDIDAWWKEKDSMIEQLRIAQNADPKTGVPLKGDDENAKGVAP